MLLVFTLCGLPRRVNAFLIWGFWSSKLLLTHSMSQMNHCLEVAGVTISKHRYGVFVHFYLAQRLQYKSLGVWDGSWDAPSPDLSLLWLDRKGIMSVHTHLDKKRAFLLQYDQSNQYFLDSTEVVKPFLLILLHIYSNKQLCMYVKYLCLVCPFTCKIEKKLRD